MKLQIPWRKPLFVNGQNQLCYIQHRARNDYVVWLRSETRLYEVTVVESRRSANDIVKMLKMLSLEERDQVIKKSTSNRYFKVANQSVTVKRT